MLDNILNIVKEVATSTVSNNADVPTEKKDLVINTATDAIASGLKNNIGGLAGLLGGKGGGNPILDTIQQSVVSALTQKAGLNPAIASTLVSTLLPAVINALSGKANSGDSGFSIESIVGALSGEKKGGGILGALGKLFG